jgi:hypothetical protein
MKGARITGISSVGVTLIGILVVELKKCPSDANNVIISGPLKLRGGVYERDFTASLSEEKVASNPRTPLRKSPFIKIPW